MNHKNELLRISEAIEANTVIINNVEPVHIAHLGLSKILLMLNLNFLIIQEKMLML